MYVISSVLSDSVLQVNTQFCCRLGSTQPGRLGFVHRLGYVWSRFYPTSTFATDQVVFQNRVFTVFFELYSAPTAGSKMTNSDEN